MGVNLDDYRDESNKIDFEAIKKEMNRQSEYLKKFKYNVWQYVISIRTDEILPLAISIEDENGNDMFLVMSEDEIKRYCHSFPYINVKFILELTKNISKSFEYSKKENKTYLSNFLNTHYMNCIQPKFKKYNLILSVFDLEKTLKELYEDYISYRFYTIEDMEEKHFKRVAEQNKIMKLAEDN